jgi:hypothetical protein
MKKFILVLSLMVFTSAMTNVNSSITKHVMASKVPDAVMATFNGQISDLMNTWFPGNDGWDDSGMNWNHEKSDWRADGMVTVNGGNGNGVQIVDALYDNNGNFHYVYYNIIQQ